MSDRHDVAAADARELAAKLAPLLPGWTLALHPDLEWCDWADLVRADGAAIRVKVGGWRREGRVTFYGVRPRYRDGSPCSLGDGVEITCDARKAPEALAKDVRRRLLPAYDAAYAAAVASVRQDDAHADEADAVAARLALTLGAQLGDPKARRGDERRIFDTPASVYRLAVRSGYSSGLHSQPVRVDFEVHGLDPETAARVLELIAEAERGPRVAAPARIEALEEADNLETSQKGVNDDTNVMPRLSARVGS